MEQLPKFSKYVEDRIRTKDTDLIWQRAIDESARHYLGLYPCISSSDEYQIIGRQMIAE